VHPYCDSYFLKHSSIDLFRVARTGEKGGRIPEGKKGIWGLLPFPISLFPVISGPGSTTSTGEKGEGPLPIGKREEEKRSPSPNWTLFKRMAEKIPSAFLYYKRKGGTLTRK